MDKEIKKDKLQKLERKLQTRKLTIYQALQQDLAVDWFKAGNPAFLSMLNQKAMIQIITYVIIPGPPQDKIRSYKVPMIAADILSTLLPKIYQLFFLEEQNEKGGHVLGRLLTYFDTEPNYIISGYVVKILTNLMVGNAQRVLEYVLKFEPLKILKYLQSHSIAEYLLKIMIVQDALLNCQAKERLTLFNAIIDIYSESKQSQEILANVNYMLCESILRLWTHKHKQLGRFSASLFRLVEIVIDNNNLYQQENLILVIVKHLTMYNKEAPFLIIALYKKIYNEFLLSKSNELIKSQGKLPVAKFSSKKYKYLQALLFIFLNSSEIIVKSLSTSNIFSFLFEFVIKYEWNNLVLIQIQKILKAAFATNNQNIYNVLHKINFLQKIKELIRSEAIPHKFGHGYSGFLKSILTTLNENFINNTALAQFIRKINPENDFFEVINEYVCKNVSSSVERTDTYKVVHDVARPFYSISKLPEIFKGFFDQTEEINARMQIEASPMKHSKQEEDVLGEIQNENQLVYKLLNQSVSENGYEEKKIDSDSNE